MRGYIYIVRTFFKRYTTWKNSKLRLKISMSLLFTKMKYGEELFFDCNEAWNIISKRIASIVLNKYCSKDDVDILKIPSLKSVINYCIFMKIANELKRPHDENNILDLTFIVHIYNSRSKDSLMV